jgi:imidazolonepropionase
MAEATLIIKNAEQLVTSTGFSGKPMLGDDLARLEIIQGGAVAVKGTRILAVGTTEEVLEQVELTPASRVLDARGKIVLPGLVDSHTHTVFAGSREHELELKIKGMSYLEILARGGGILSSVQSNRAASKADLVKAGLKYTKEMLSQGTTTAEAKSGYGLTTQDELKTLEAIAEVDARQPLDLIPTFLGGHAVPPEYKDNSDGYVDLVIQEMLPRVAAKKLARFCDVFCEKGAFSVEQSRRILQAAAEAGLGLKIHADEIVPLGGAELAAELHAVSADHLLAISEEGIRRMASELVVAVLLPGTTFYLREKHFAPARKLIEAGVPVALATDFNPGSCPNNNMQIIMTLACLYLEMTPAEIVNAMTINAAHALGLAGDIGSLEADKLADIVIFAAPSYLYLPYRFGTNMVSQVIKGGRVVVE